jgi:hypothetical protein
MRCAFGRRAFTAVTGTARVDLDVVDPGAGAVRQTDLHRPIFMSSSTTTTGPAKRAFTRSSLTEDIRRTSASRVGTIHCPCRFSDQASRAVHPVGRRRDDRTGPGRSPTTRSNSPRARAKDACDERSSKKRDQLTSAGAQLITEAVEARNQLAVAARGCR